MRIKSRAVLNKNHSRSADDRKSEMPDESLEANGDWYRAIFNEASDGIALIDFETGHIYDCNPEFERLTGRNLEQLKKMKIWEIRPPGKRETARKKFFEIRDKGTGGATELELQKPDGESVPVEFKAKAIEFRGKHYIQSIIHDITDRKRSEAALKESEAKLRGLLENIPDFVITVDRNHKIMMLNRPVPGVTMEEAIGVELYNYVEPAHHDIMRGALNKVFQIGIPERYQVLGIGPEGPNTAWYETRVFPINIHDQIVYATLISSDITERKRAEEELRESEERYREVVERAHDGIGILQDGVIEYSNPRFASVVGSTPDELIGIPITDYIHPDQLATVIDRYKRRIAGEITDSTYEITLLHKNGSTVNVEASTGAIAYQGRPAALIVARDITERKKMEQQLQLAGRLAAVGELAAGVAHELNNPLAAMQAYAEFLGSRDDLDELAKADAKTIHDQAQRAARITGNLLSFARQHRPEKSLISINEIIRKSLELHAYSMKVNNIEVITELEADLPDTMADFYQLQQVFVNLLNNAEQAMMEANGSGMLIVKTQNVDHMIQITFIDNGPGIPDGNIKSLFDPFFTTKEVGKGTGLGLSICYGIIREHGGYLNARSKSGEGATFVVEIPVVSEDETAAYEDDPESALQQTSNPA